MKKCFTLIAMMAVCFGTTDIHAQGTFGSSILTITDAKFQRFDTATSTWVDAVAFVTNLSGTFTSSDTAMLTGFVDTSNQGNSSFDVAQAFLGSGSPPAENSFVSNGMATTYARSDVDGSGAFFGPSPCLSTSTLSEVSALNGESGYTDGGFASSGTFQVAAGGGGSYRLSVNASLALTATSDATGTALAGAGFGINVNSTGFDGGILTNFQPSELNQVVTGNDSHNFSGVLTSSAFNFVAGRNYSFSHNQGTGALITGTAVPEPGSMAVLGLVSLAVVGRRRRS